MFFQTWSSWLWYKHAAEQRQWVWKVKKKNPKNHKKIHRLGALLTGWGFICGFFSGGWGCYLFVFLAQTFARVAFHPRLLREDQGFTTAAQGSQDPPAAPPLGAGPSRAAGAPPPPARSRARPRDRSQKWVKGRAAAAPPRASPAAPGLSTRAGKALPDKSSQRKGRRAAKEAKRTSERIGGLSSCSRASSSPVLSAEKPQ